MSERDLKLNSLDRFAKHSPRFALEQFGSCEVPAGCGGVVIRWAPRGQLSLNGHVSILATGEHETFLDGEEKRSIWRLTEGRHALGVRVEAPDFLNAFLMAAISFPPGARTAADGTWRATLTAPPPDWSRVGFDDSGWTALVEGEIPHGPPPRPGESIGQDRFHDYEYARLSEVGACPLGLPEPRSKGGSVWVRREFEVKAQ